jgi:hypothetical protein
MLKRAGVKRSARLVPYGSISRSGDFDWMAVSHHRPDATVVTRLMLDDGEVVSYVIVYEPVSGWWLVLPEGAYPGAEDWARIDVFDQIWMTQGAVAPSKDDSLSFAVMSHGYLPPWIGTPAQAGVAKRRFTGARMHWTNLMTDEGDLDTRECPGCDECEMDGGTRVFHRIRVDAD